MKKFLVLVLLLVGGYFVYDNFIKEKELVSVKANYVKNRESVDVNAPALQARDFAHYEGSLLNVSEETLTNITVTYLIDAKKSIAKIDKLEPGEEKNFYTDPVMLRHSDAAHHFESIEYDGMWYFKTVNNFSIT